LRRGLSLFIATVTAAVVLSACQSLPARAGSSAAVEPAKHHGVHREALTEWWYFVGHLKSDTGRAFGYQLTFFKYSTNGFFAHAAITDDAGKTFSFVRRFYASADVQLGQDALRLEYGGMRARQRSTDVFDISGDVERGRLDLVLQSVKPPLLARGVGSFAMPEGDSFYYSLTNLRTTGTLRWNGEDFTVSGTSWMDHQWGRFAVTQTRWDWFSIQMDDGTEYSIYSFRDKDGQDSRQLVGVSAADGSTRSLTSAQIRRVQWWTSPTTGLRYVSEWEIFLPATGERFVMEATVVDQEVYSGSIFDVAPTYWEGRCKVTRMSGAVRTAGVGYAEQFPHTGTVQ
jgi:predicted secreted hydrolase